MRRDAAGRPRRGEGCERVDTRPTSQVVDGAEGDDVALHEEGREQAALVEERGARGWTQGLPARS